MRLSFEADQIRFREMLGQFHEKQEQNKVKYAAFAIPVKEGRIYLATRNTPPFKGLYSAVGGKIDKSTEVIGFGDPTPSSMNLGSLGFERPTTAAVREFCEEMYSDMRYPIDFNLDLFEIAKLFCIDDAVTGVSCYIRLVKVPPYLDFHPSPREIGEVRQLSDIDPAQINPLTAVALIGMAREKSCADFHSQIPSLDQIAADYFGPLGGEYLLSYPVGSK